MQPPAPTDYFSFFGLPRALNIEPSCWRSRCCALAAPAPRPLQPRSAQEQEWPLEQTSKLNDAYRTLRDPVSRTEYLLRLEGIRTTDAAPGMKRHRPARCGPPAGLLEEVFEVNMQLEEYRGGERDERLRHELQEAKSRLEAKLHAVSDELKSCWKAWDELLARGSTPSAEVPALAGDLAEEAAIAERRRVLEQMLDVLKRRRYLTT